MAKKKEEQTRYIGELDGYTYILLEHAEFVYNIDLYKISTNSFGLADSRTVAHKKYIPNTREVRVEDGVRYEKETLLIAAPKDWLDKNKFKVYVNTVKQKLSKTKV